MAIATGASQTQNRLLSRYHANMMLRNHHDQPPNLPAHPPSFRSQRSNCSAELAENHQNLRLTVDLPGVLSKDLQVRIHDNVLTVKAIRRFMSVDNTSCIKRRKIHHRYGINPEAVNTSLVQAVLSNGVLTISAPKNQRNCLPYTCVPISNDAQMTSSVACSPDKQDDQNTAHEANQNPTGKLAPPLVSDDNSSYGRGTIKMSQK